MDIASGPGRRVNFGIAFIVLVIVHNIVKRNQKQGFPSSLFSGIVIHLQWLDHLGKVGSTLMVHSERCR